MKVNAGEEDSTFPTLTVVEYYDRLQLFWEDVPNRRGDRAFYLDGTEYIFNGLLGYSQNSKTWSASLPLKAGQEHDFEISAPVEKDFDLPAESLTDEAPDKSLEEGPEPDVADFSSSEFTNIKPSEIDQNDKPAPDTSPTSLTFGAAGEALPDNSLQAAQQRVEALAARSISSYFYKHVTFIPANRVKAAPCSFRAGATFGGDNRSWSSTSTRFRTRISVSVYFWGKTAEVWAGREVGSTSLYNKSGKRIAKKTASSKGMRVYIKSRTANSATLRLSHSVSNPFCVAGSIYYQTQVTLRKNGSYAILGSHRWAPNHEIYRKTGSSPWKSSYEKKMKDFKCLVPGGCRKPSISRSGR